MDRLKETDRRIRQIVDELGPMGVESPLIDSDGYPLTDFNGLDLLTVRSMRNQLACLLTDRKQLLLQIESDLPQLLASNKGRPRPFLEVRVVDEFSPAWKSGLRPGDRIVKFGGLTRLDASGMACVSQVVQDVFKEKSHIKSMKQYGIEGDSNSSTINISKVSDSTVTVGEECCSFIDVKVMRQFEDESLDSLVSLKIVLDSSDKLGCLLIPL